MKKSRKLIQSVTAIATMMLVMAASASADTVPSNANDDFISKPVGGTKFDLGQSYEVDAITGMFS